jgi:chromosome segregation ATPase
VNKGASNKPKILGSAKQRLGKDAYNQLAASSSPEAVQYSYMTCSPTQSETTGETMDLSALTNQVSTLSAANGKLEVKLETTEAALTASQSEVAALKGQVEELNTKIEEGSDTKLQSDLSAAQEQLAAANKIVGVFDEQVKLAAKMAGLTLAEDASADEKIELLQQAQIKLAAIPRGGVGKGADAPEDDNILVLTAAHNSAFVSNR